MLVRVLFGLLAGWQRPGTELNAFRNCRDLQRTDMVSTNPNHCKDISGITTTMYPLVSSMYLSSNTYRYSGFPLAVVKTVY